MRLRMVWRRCPRCPTCGLREPAWVRLRRATVLDMCFTVYLHAVCKVYLRHFRQSTGRALQDNRKIRAATPVFVPSKTAVDPHPGHGATAARCDPSRGASAACETGSSTTVEMEFQSRQEYLNIFNEQQWKIAEECATE